MDQDAACQKSLEHMGVAELLDDRPSQIYDGGSLLWQFAWDIIESKRLNGLDKSGTFEF